MNLCIAMMQRKLTSTVCSSPTRTSHIHGSLNQSHKDNVFAWQSDRRRRDSERENLPSAASLLDCPRQPGLGHAEIRSQELHPGSPHGWREAKSYGHHLPSPGMLGGNWMGLCVMGVPSGDLLYHIYPSYLFHLVFIKCLRPGTYNFPFYW